MRGDNVRIGTQGWSYPDWIGVFYPPGSKQEDYLPFYAEVFDTVELDTTFYHPPKPTIVRSWARHTPDDFRFAAKVPQAITHVARLSSMGEQIEAFVRALEPLGERRGPLLVQMPADFVRDEGTGRRARPFPRRMSRGGADRGRVPRSLVAPGRDVRAAARAPRRAGVDRVARPAARAPR